MGYWGAISRKTTFFFLLEIKSLWQGATCQLLKSLSEWKL